MKGLFLLFDFMTRLPLPVKVEFDSNEFGKSMKFFPIIGIVIGLILFLIYELLAKYIISSLVVALVIVLVEVILTGALHLNGFANTFDSIFSYRSKQKMLDTMNDSKIGTNGAISLVIYFLAKIILLAGMIDFSNKIMGIGNYAGVVILVTPILSRINPVLNCCISPYAKASGKVKSFVEKTDKLSLLIAVAISLLFTVIVGRGVYEVLNPLHIVNIVAINMVLGVYYSKLVDKKIGGLTGDTLGAVVELSNIVILFGFYISLMTNYRF